MFIPWLLGTGAFILFLFFQAQGIYTGDSGDLVTAAVLGGVPHPPGYPLYTLLGFIASKLPLLTPSFRVTLLSSVPHAVTVALVFLLIYRFTRKNVAAALFGSLTLLFNYLFFLYSVTPEVFALFDMFVVVLLWLLIRWKESGDARHLLWAGFVLGLSLAHHHVILFFVPALSIVLLSRLRTRHAVSPRLIVASAACLLLGLLPYLYVVIAARYDPIVNWDRPVAWDGFFRLVTRLDYGTFVSGGSIGHSLAERLVAVTAYGRFLVLDWTIVGIAFLLAGFSTLYARNRTVFWALVAGVSLLGPAFFFYASFPLVSRFTLGTYERFLLPGYVLLAVVCGVGFARFQEELIRRLRPRVRAQIVPTVALLTSLVFFLLPVSQAGMTLYRFWGLSADKTAEALGRDFLETAPPNAILLMSQDTPLFTTQYVRYVLGVRSDTAVIHAARMPGADYRIVLRRRFPDLIVPETEPSQAIAAFVKANTDAGRTVLSNIILPVGDGWYWVPRGLWYEAVSGASLPGASAMYAQASKNMALFADPMSGILSRYPHLMLSDVLDVYANGMVGLGKTLVRAGMWQEARDVFRKAVSYNGDSSIVESLELLGMTELYFKSCGPALDAFSEAERRSPVKSATLVRLTAVTYADCVGDASRAAHLFSEYERLERETEQPLESL